VTLNRGQQVSAGFFSGSVGNKHLNLQEGGGLASNDKVPAEVHALLHRFLSGDTYKNPSVSMSSQFLTFLQHGLVSLDDILLRYKSPVYNACPLKVRNIRMVKGKF
jgi:hypothetical protein